MGDTRVIILAAGNGTRMGAAVPKVLVPVAGVPMLTRLIHGVRASGIDKRPLVVVSRHGADAVSATCGNDAECIVQDPPRGTGDAVRVACSALGADVRYVHVLYGDHPFVRAESMRSLAALHRASASPLACLTTSLPDFADWRAAFIHFGRIVRSDSGAFTRIIEYADASRKERALREVNPGLFRFSLPWLRTALAKLTPKNAQGEYYLTDLIEYAIAEGYAIPTHPLPPEESIGLNTREDVAWAETMLR